MKIFPAIDIYGGKAVRLYKGNYDEMTVYSDHPEEIAISFLESGAKNIHLVDLEGARDGNTPNIDTVKKIRSVTDAFIEIGGGIRSLEVIDKYIEIGVDRVILGTAAVKDRAFLLSAVEKYGEKIAVGIDIKDGKVAIHGWTEKSDLDGLEFCKDMENIGVKTIICTDISRDGAMRGTNLELYKTLKNQVSLNVIASGGVTDMNDIINLKNIDVYGAIIGKAYYTGAIDIKEAVEATK